MMEEAIRHKDPEWDIITQEKVVIGAQEGHEQIATRETELLMMADIMVLREDPQSQQFTTDIQEAIEIFRALGDEIDEIEVKDILEEVFFPLPPGPS